MATTGLGRGLSSLISSNNSGVNIKKIINPQKEKELEKFY